MYNGIGTVDVTDDELAALTISIEPGNISENGGTATVTITRNTDPGAELTVNLSSDDTSEATVPATAFFGEGDSTTTVTLSAVDDAFADGPQTVTVTASADDFTDGSDQVEIIDDEIANLTLSIEPLSISENGGSAIVTISRNTEALGELTVNLSSDDTSEATVPATVSFVAGEASTTFTLTAINDALADGAQIATITAMADGFTNGTAPVGVTDDEVATLTVTIAPTSITENGGNATVTITRNTEALGELIVNLSSDDTSEATVPATATFTAEQASTTVSLSAVDDIIADGLQTVTITASADGFIDGSGQVDVTDDELPTLTLAVAPASISENAGTSASSVTVTRNTDTTSALVVTLTSDDTSEATVPATLTIPAGQASATTDLDAVDDAIVDGTQTVTITASATGFTRRHRITVDVTDDDVPTLTLTIADPSISENGGTSTVIRIHAQHRHDQRSHRHPLRATTHPKQPSPPPSPSPQDRPPPPPT